MNPTDDELRRLFDEERRSDEASAPPFRSLLARRPERPPAGSRRLRLPLAAAALAVMAAAIVVAIGVRSLRRPPEIPPARIEARIESWKAPTDFLLEPSFMEPINTVPALAAPVPDYSSLLAETKGRKS